MGCLEGSRKQYNLGNYASAAEAALAYARHIGPAGCTASLPPARPMRSRRAALAKKLEMPPAKRQKPSSDLEEGRDQTGAVRDEFTARIPDMASALRSLQRGPMPRQNLVFV